MAPAWRIAQPYCVALAPGAKSFKKSEALWYAGSRTLSGEDKLCELPTEAASAGHGLARPDATINTQHADNM